MKNLIQNIKNSKGFVSIESILVIGAIVILAGLILFFFNGKADGVTKASGAQITTTSSKVQTPTDAGNTATLAFPVTPPTA